MVLVDTSVWVTHLRKGLPALDRALSDGLVYCHPLIVGEIACGYLKNRTLILSLLSTLPQTQEVTMNEILHFIERRRLMGSGLGLIDIHLLASASLSRIPLWTSDKKLLSEAVKLRLYYDLSSS